MDRIEFIGAYYVGKSTLYKAYSSQGDRSDRYVIDKDIRAIARQKKGKVVYTYRSILSRIFRIFGGTLNVYNLPNQGKFKNHSLEKYKRTLALCFQEELILSTDFPLAYKTYSRLSKIIDRYQHYDSLGTNKVLLTEESIIHWHQVLHELLLDDSFVFTEEQLKDKGLFPRALIYCYADAEVILERIKMRKNSNQLNIPDLELELNDVLKRVMLKQEVLLKYSVIAKKNGVDVLRIDTGETIEKNVKKINAFLQSLYKPQKS